MTACDYCRKPATEHRTIAGLELSLCAKCAAGERRAKAATILPIGYDQARFEADVEALWGPKRDWEERQERDSEAVRAAHQQRQDEARSVDSYLMSQKEEQWNEANQSSNLQRP